MQIKIITQRPGSVNPRFLATLTTSLNGFPSSTSLITYPNVPVIKVYNKARK
jgi:hypothetical protein